MRTIDNFLWRYRTPLIVADVIAIVAVLIWYATR